ncbi:GtrA family protein [Specibacter cremeus]|uniref:GtrA family protein n=1 Tax=Specibacter cremeus TaxID=1629051 RepID=UPI000F768483|nr:GtrA family protein [Specibacter cremeus]
MATASAAAQPAPKPRSTGTASQDEGARRRAVLRRQIRGFCLVAVICTVISMAIFASLRGMVGLQWANGISLVLCSVLNTELNRRISFDANDANLWWRDQRRGLWVMLIALAMTSGSLWLLEDAAPHAPLIADLVVITLANVAAAVTRFLMMRYWIFRRTRYGARQPAAAVSGAA